MKFIDSNLFDYINKSILPNYFYFDKGHNIDHAHQVINSSLKIAKDYDVKPDMVYVVAAYHDVGIKFGRKKHHLHSGEILFNDNNLKNWFDEEEINTMKKAVEEHRASYESEPESIYGKIVSVADRDHSSEKLIYRALQFGLTYMPHYSKSEHLERVYEYIEKKYGDTGYIKLWLESEETLNGFYDIKNILSDKRLFKKKFSSILGGL